VVERKNMINIYLKGRACIESVSKSFFSFVSLFYFELFLALICHFGLVSRFLCLLLALRFSLFLDDLLKFFSAFWSSRCAS
jgi:hypothetical protein